jgi:hypothetical protein
MPSPDNGKTVAKPAGASDDNQASLSAAWLKADPEPLSQLSRQRLLLTSIREFANGKRQILWSGAGARAHRRRMIGFSSGVIALVSGGSAAALLVPIANLMGVKIVSATLAFASGIITLLSASFYDDKETARMYVAAAAYGDLRDRISVVLNKPDLTLAEAHRAYVRFTEQSSKLSKDHDQLIGQAAMREVSAAIAKRLLKEGGSYQLLKEAHLDYYVVGNSRRRWSWSLRKS